jgi:hypothetical protein
VIELAGDALLPAVIERRQQLEDAEQIVDVYDLGVARSLRTVFIAQRQNGGPLELQALGLEVDLDLAAGLGGCGDRDRFPERTGRDVEGVRPDLD